jgi:hypothetical protein
MLQNYRIGAVMFISFLHEDHFIHAFAASSIRTTVTTSYTATIEDVLKRTTTTTTTTTTTPSPFHHVVTSIYSSRNSFYDDEEEEEEHDVGRFMNFDFDSAREQLETLVGAGGVGGDDDDEYQQQQQQLQQRRPTLSNIRLMKEDHDTTISSSLSGGASIASSPAMFDVIEPPELSVELPRRPPLTSIERERRLAEIQLLQNLRDDDDDGAISDLWSLWFAERGPRAESILREADELMGGHISEQLEAERLLRALIEEYGVYFVEPLNRLATLYFTQGRLEEALALNKIVLAVKPWHVGSLSQIVMVYEAMGDSMSARSWARFRLPTISHMGSSSSNNNKRRERWIEKAVTDATRLYEQGEVTNSMAFGESDNRFYQKKNTEDDPWQ